MILLNLRFALRGIGANKLRSTLTVLGIMIGVGSVILLVAVGQGSSRRVQSSIEQLGTDTLTVLATGGASSGTRTRTYDLTVADARAIADATSAPDVASVSPEVSTSVTAVYGGTSHSVNQAIGTYPSYFAATNSPVRAGGYFTDADVTAARRVVVIGSTVATDVFGTVNPIGKKLRLNGQPFTVRGVLADKGSSGGFSDPGDVVIAPLSTMRQTLTGYGSVDSLLVRAASPATVSAAEGEITAILDARHHVRAAGSSTAGGTRGNTSRSSGSSPYTVTSRSQLLSARSSTESTFTVLLGAVAGISLLVGGIGITNIMLVTVTERTREIGIRKALGAPRHLILGQFLLEATLLSVLGGLLGVAAGLIGSHVTIVGIQPVVVPGSVVLALAVSVLIGLFFGGYPANRAAGMRPIDALRHD